MQKKRREIATAWSGDDLHVEDTAFILEIKEMKVIMKFTLHYGFMWVICKVMHSSY